MIRILLLALALLAIATPARADAVVAINEVTSFWSICPGDDIESGGLVQCALDDCATNSGGTCVVLLECPYGWLAVAESGTPELGRGFACGIDEAGHARMMALIACAAATNRICDGRGVIGPDGEQSFDRAEEDPASTAVYAQYLLDGLGFEIGEIDGAIGPKTRQAMRQWETSAGLPATGEITVKTLELMIYSIWGRQVVVDSLTASNEVMPENLKPLMTSFALSQRPRRTLGYELARVSDDELGQVLSVIVSTSKEMCPTPYWEVRRDFAYLVVCDTGSGKQWLLTTYDDGGVGITEWVEPTWMYNGSGTRADIPL